MANRWGKDLRPSQATSLKKGKTINSWQQKVKKKAEQESATSGAEEKGRKVQVQKPESKCEVTKENS